MRTFNGKNLNRQRERERGETSDYWGQEKSLLWSIVDDAEH